MDVVFYIFDITPFVIISSIIAIIVAIFIKNKKAKKILATTGIIDLFGYTIFLMSIAIPNMFLSALFENGDGIIAMISIIIAVWAIVSLFIYLKNRYIIRKNNIKEIYIRDIDVKYSPAVLSYLMNNKIEPQKDLPATLLNLCTKNILKIEETETRKIEVIDLKNQKAVEELSDDEKYAYKMLLEGVTSSKLSYWKNKVEDEYIKYGFSKKHNKSLGTYLIGIYISFFIGIFLYCIISGEFEITGQAADIIAKIIITTFIAAWEMIIFAGIKKMITGILNRNDKNEFKDMYTKKGAKEYSKWKSFERFIEQYSLIKEREYESVVIWGKYLSYSIALGINKKCDRELYNKIEKEYCFNYDLLSRIYAYEEK